MAGLSTGTRANSSDRNSVISLDNSFETAGSDLILEIAYESRIQSENVRIGKHGKVLGLAVHPVNEDQISFLTSDGRVYFLEYEEGISCQWLPRGDCVWTDQKINIKSIVGCLSGQLKIIKMCPPLCAKNESVYRPLLAAGSNSGNLLFYNLNTGSLEREVSVHTSAVADIEWISDFPSPALLSCSYNPVTGSNVVKNELILTSVLTGKTKVLRGERGEESKITMIRVSSSLQFFVIAFANAPFELWDARKFCLLRTMPKKFPHVSALTWSPNHKSRKKNSLPSESEKQTGKPGLVKEHILFSDLDCQLFHFLVEGHSIRDGSKIPAETGLGIFFSFPSSETHYSYIPPSH
jgi:WD40 repeat protein